MKFRRDFVTNSSSSSFVLEIRFDMKDGKVVEFEDMGGTPEGDEGKFFKHDAVAKVSPKQLGTASNMDELIKLLMDGVIDYNKWAEDPDAWHEEGETPQAERKIFSTRSKFIRSIKQAASSMDDIRSITIAGKEENCGTQYHRIYTYDRETGQYTGIQKGKPITWAEGHCGNVVFSDANTCMISFE